MTYKNDIDIKFEHNGVGYGAHADVVVKMRKADVGPVGHREHVMAYVPDDIEVNNLTMGLLPFGEDFAEIPLHLKLIAEDLISIRAAFQAEASFE